MNRNYQKELDRILEKECNRGKTLLLHSCCAPCSSYCMEYLREYFRITVFYYNPNITIEPEYRKRLEEEKRLIFEYNRQLETGNLEGMNSTTGAYPIKILEGAYTPQVFLEMAKGREQCPEGKERCFLCYEMRLRKTAEVAKKGQFDYFTTTLSISPLKNAQKLNEIGERLSEEFKVPYLVSDFKKKNGYLRSIRLSEQFHLYRQDYCGCIYSKAERRRAQKQKEQGDL